MIARLERSVRLALPATEEIEVGDWVLRLSGGATKRVNSANPVVAGARVEDVQDVAEQRYAAHGLPVRFRLTPLADPGGDARLAAAGYDRIDPSFTMLAPPVAAAVDPAVRLSPDPDGLADYARIVGWSAEDVATHARLLAALPPAHVFATLIEDVPIGHGVASVADGVAWLFDIAIAPEARGRGAGRRLVAALLGWAAAQRCEAVGLQVLGANAAARALYHRLGFTDAYPYHYRIRRG